MIDDEIGPRANRERATEAPLAIFRGNGQAGDTTGNCAGTKWVAFNAIAEHLDYGRRYTPRSNQMQRSFEDPSLKQRALELVSGREPRLANRMIGLGIRVELGCPALKSYRDLRQ